MKQAISGWGESLLLNSIDTKVEIVVTSYLTLLWIIRNLIQKVI